MTDLTKAETITVADGKYIISNNNGALTVLRNGEPWNRDLSGDNLVYWMFVEIQQLRAALAAQQAAQPVALGKALERECTDPRACTFHRECLGKCHQPLTNANTAMKLRSTDAAAQPQQATDKEFDSDDMQEQWTAREQK